MQYCPLQHRTLLLPPATSTTGYCSCFGSIFSFFLELFLHWSPVAYGHLLTWGVHLSLSYLFAFSYYSWSSRGKNTDVVCHSLLQWAMFCPQKNYKSIWRWYKNKTKINDGTRLKARRGVRLPLGSALSHRYYFSWLLTALMSLSSDTFPTSLKWYVTPSPMIGVVRMSAVVHPSWAERSRPRKVTKSWYLLHVGHWL